MTFKLSGRLLFRVEIDGTGILFDPRDGQTFMLNRTSALICRCLPSRRLLLPFFPSRVATAMHSSSTRKETRFSTQTSVLPPHCASLMSSFWRLFSTQKTSSRSHARLRNSTPASVAAWCKEPPEAVDWW